MMCGLHGVGACSLSGSSLPSARYSANRNGLDLDCAIQAHEWDRNAKGPALRQRQPDYIEVCGGDRTNNRNSLELQSTSGVQRRT